ncbi:MAG: hypothetical protein K2X93_00075 [Candidatus Obscuribacterales bacterium]|nr:hypothetical protein [Candidatus Obscuribacterales bacterium]
MEAIVNVILGIAKAHRELTYQLQGVGGPRATDFRRWIDERKLDHNEYRRLSIVDAICTNHLVYYFGRTRSQATELTSGFMLDYQVVYGESGMKEAAADLLRTDGDDRHTLMAIYVGFLIYIGMPSAQLAVERASDMTVLTLLTYKQMEQGVKKTLV